MTEAELYSLYKGVYVPHMVNPAEALQQYEEMSFRHDDVLIATYPKSGTTWMQELVCLIMSGGDPESVETSPNWVRVPWLETDHRIPLELRPSPRLLATHFSHRMMPQSFYQVKPKVIYVMRNPKDVCTSDYYFHIMSSFLVTPSSKRDFLHKFLEGKMIYGSWFDHVKSWLSAADTHRIMYICYEEMIEDLRGAVGRISKFLDKPLEQEVIEQIADRCVFDNMKKNNMSNYSTAPPEILDQSKGTFMRKGVAGDWKNFLTVAEAEHFDAVYEKEMKGVGHELKMLWIHY
uniref:Sulfotransferase n=1 Tax=Neogobius melanostomus TaxID=47308 RepID=A0A8C6T2T7_9GOBI